jgi:hypothetical protein
MISRIGNRTKTQIFRDQWIPRDSGLKITALKKNTRKRWVNQLICQESRCWNETLLKDLFYDHDVQSILEIEIPRTSQEDRYAWHPERNEIFSVRSAYKLAYRLKHKNREISSSSVALDEDRSLWNTIWKADVQPKVRVFRWRVATDSLATKNNKFRSKLEVNKRCSICGYETEDAYHATVRCTKAAALCHTMRKHWSLPDESAFTFSGKDWLQILLGHLDNLTRS